MCSAVSLEQHEEHEQHALRKEEAHELNKREQYVQVDRQQEGEAAALPSCFARLFMSVGCPLRAAAGGLWRAQWLGRGAGD